MRGEEWLHFDDFTAANLCDAIGCTTKPSASRRRIPRPQRDYVAFGPIPWNILHMVDIPVEMVLGPMGDLIDLQVISSESGWACAQEADEQTGN